VTRTNPKQPTTRLYQRHVEDAEWIAKLRYIHYNDETMFGLEFSKYSFQLKGLSRWGFYDTTIADAGEVRFLFTKFGPETPGERAFIMFSRFFLSLYMTGEEMVMQRSGEARSERRDKFCLFVCLLAYAFSSFLCRCCCFYFLAFFLIFRP
jgi:hypothetical protein